MFPTPDLKRRTDVALELLSGARSLRFTNRAGTDVTYRIGYPAKAQYGFVDSPGQWDHWPSGGMVLTCGEDDGIDGRVVVDRGDILLPFKQYVVEPIELTIEAGRITEIAGDGYQAELIRTYVADFDDPDAYGLSHIGWGLDERAKWAALATDARGHGMELRAFYGNVLFSTGPNDLVGGPNHTSCHLDIPMRGCSLYLDETPVIVDGEVVIDSMRPSGAPVAA
jgi:2,5-dihydroxypyridine 5,6-dioxygenase